MSTKMARASEADLEAANEVANMLGDLEKRYMPTPKGDMSLDTEFFDRDDAEDCKRALGMLLDAASKGSLFRVTFGMMVVLDPSNELLDPAADTLEKHPKIVAALAAYTPREPAAWTLNEELERRETICDAHMWFVNPQNSSWAPLFTADQVREAMLAATERAARVCDSMSGSDYSPAQCAAAIRSGGEGGS